MKQATTPFLLAILIAAGGPGAGVGFAQVGYRHSSIEWLTASSDVVVRASVADLAYKDRAPEVGESRSQWQWVTVTLNVRATLKGKAPETIGFVNRTAVAPSTSFEPGANSSQGREPPRVLREIEGMRD